ncbi:hypothetical protein F5Y12DRAFT_89094 [Xylaria sp. FL1777]|nr:hypothetical protein F5Y12DRAFT_89094 [Xylaria sp. FL1777]
MDEKQNTPAKTADGAAGNPPSSTAAAPVHHATPTRNNNNAADVKAEIVVPPPSAADDAALTAALTLLVNKVYSEAERGIYSTEFERTSAEDVAEQLRAGEVAVAYLPHRSSSDADAAAAAANNKNNKNNNAQHEEEGEGSAATFLETHGTPIGCIAMKQASPTTGEFGMLAVDPTHRGGGVGRDLVVFAEEWCRGRLGLQAMRLELLAPVHFEHVGKTRLQAWYERLGYVRLELRDFEKAYPRLYELLSGPTEFRVFEKKFG